MLLPLVDSTSFSGLESIPKNYAQIGYISKRNKRSKDFFPKNSREFPKNQSRSSGIPKSRKFSIPNFGNPEIPKISIPKFREFPNPENFGNPELRESRKKFSGKSPTLVSSYMIKVSFTTGNFFCPGDIFCEVVTPTLPI